MTVRDEGAAVSRRAVLRASAGTAGLLGVGSAGAGGDERSAGADPCDETTLRPSTVPYDDSVAAVCADAHPETRAIESAVETALTERFPTVGSLLDAGFVPYFDFFAAGDGGWSHWLNPEFVADDSVLDAARPESVLVDHRWWRPIGVMFVAACGGERVDPPPAVYGEGAVSDGATGRACRPWHAHVGLPGRYSWWKFRAYSAEHPGDLTEFRCRTPWVMHVWRYDHPESVYAHHAPPRGHRGGPPAEDAGFATDAVPGEDPLGPEVLPDAVLHRLAHL